MKKTGLLALIMIFVFAIPSTKAETPNISTIAKKTMNAIDKGRQGSRKVVIHIKEGDNVVNQWSARNAIKEFEDGTHSLLVILEPPQLKGYAYLLWKPINEPMKKWMYFPPTRRVRPIEGTLQYESFLGTDFTISDFGMSDPSGEHTFIAEETHQDRKSYKIQTIPSDQWLYTKIVSWIDAENFLPIQRDYYDSSGKLWKSKFYENVVLLNNIPIPLKVRMVDVHTQNSTELLISDVCFDVEYIPRDAFDVDKLPTASLSPVCAVPPPAEED